MKKSHILLVALVLGAMSLLVVVYAQAQRDDDERDHKVPYTSLPEAVRTAAEKILGGPGDYEAETEVEEGIRWYEVEAEHAGREMSLKFTELGNLVELEREIPFEDLPAAARRELKKDYPGAEFIEVEEVELHFYEVEFRINGTEHEIRVFASGDIEDENDGDGED